MDTISVTFIKGEKSPVFVSETPSTGTISFTGPPTFRLTDRSGNVITGFDTIPVSAYDTGGGTLAQCYYTLDTSALPVGGYIGLIAMPIATQDGTARIKEALFYIYVREA